MGRLILDQDAFALSSLMEKITRVRVKDSFKDDEGMIYFVVNFGDLGKAIGKGGVNIKKVQQELGKKVKIIEHRNNVIDFVKSIIYPIKVEEVVEEEGVISIKDSSKKAKSLLIGRGGKNLKLINRAVKRFFDKEVKVV
ncbi:MAG: NusA-like transcription termination signal-binding factor [Nanoarchaeota archaeon]|nr:NusA-like transcription termination signal-binding factor [Nanoarchaeota archaeon]MBU1632685.1 NusA-like transcription termination signal-binding factor [Nanoarchaeota archaeon]MBU1876303.1 NusA-like transcription termination signal-binding factor [Nanoarchaeota archaeon]